MNYIIKNATVCVEGNEEKKSIVINGSKVIYTHTFTSKYTYHEFNAENYRVSPGHVMLDFSLATMTNFQSFKEQIKQLICKGCTTFITAAEFQFENNFQYQLKKAKHALINSSIDFVVGMKIPISKLTPTVVRLCAKHKVPIVFVSIDCVEQIEAIPWQRIRDELFLYPIYFLPQWNEEISTNKLKKLQKFWMDRLSENKICTTHTAPNEHTPLSREFLLNAGLYPTKGVLHVGSDADYLLFPKSSSNPFDLLNPESVFVKGKAKKAENEFFLLPGCGKELVIKVPRKHIPIKNAFQPPVILIDYY